MEGDPYWCFLARLGHLYATRNAKELENRRQDGSHPETRETTIEYQSVSRSHAGVDEDLPSLVHY